MTYSKAGEPESEGKDFSLCDRKYVRFVHVADFGE